MGLATSSEVAPDGDHLSVRRREVTRPESTAADLLGLGFAGEIRVTFVEVQAVVHADRNNRRGSPGGGPTASVVSKTRRARRPHYGTRCDQLEILFSARGSHGERQAFAGISDREGGAADRGLVASPRCGRIRRFTGLLDSKRYAR